MLDLKDVLRLRKVSIDDFMEFLGVDDRGVIDSIDHSEIPNLPGVVNRGLIQSNNREMGFGYYSFEWKFSMNGNGDIRLVRGTADDYREAAFIGLLNYIHIYGKDRKASC